ncbi:unnamed protein product [Mytilus edulis]|uniref:Uncharacterized protein n=1 Tax=Mytilus edulis TaxID=6550 RepID=A0A8S3VBC2_MYTED|nr:unnamed protein product [Mytilus edulis]
MSRSLRRVGMICRYVVPRLVHYGIEPEPEPIPVTSHEMTINYHLQHFKAVVPRCEDIRGHPDEHKSPTSWYGMPLCGSTPGALRDGTRTGTITKPSYLQRHDSKLSSRAFRSSSTSCTIILRYGSSTGKYSNCEIVEVEPAHEELRLLDARIYADIQMSRSLRRVGMICRYVVPRLAHYGIEPEPEPIPVTSHEMTINYHLQHFEAVVPRCEDIRGHPDEHKSPTSWYGMPLCGSTPGALRDGTRTGTITKPSYLQRHDSKLSSRAFRSSSTSCTIILRYGSSTGKYSNCEIVEVEPAHEELRLLDARIYADIQMSRSLRRVGMICRYVVPRLAHYGIEPEPIPVTSNEPSSATKPSYLPQSRNDNKLSSSAFRSSGSSCSIILRYGSSTGKYSNCEIVEVEPAHEELRLLE